MLRNRSWAGQIISWAGQIIKSTHSTVIKGRYRILGESGGERAPPARGRCALARVSPPPQPRSEPPRPPGVCVVALKECDGITIAF